MNDPERFEHHPEIVDGLDRQFQTADKVRARFRLNEYSRPYIDLEIRAIASLGLEGHETEVDIGTGDGSFLQKWRLEAGHIGRLIGIERSASQFSYTDIWTPIEPELLADAMGRQDESNTIAEAINKRYREAFNDIWLLGGVASRLPLRDNTADVLSAMFMLYHVPEATQPQVFNEFKRVLKPDGVFVLATSGANNKQHHRVIEAAIADSLGVLPPPPMNLGFTSEKAFRELPKHFHFTYAFHQETDMVIDEALKVQHYMESLWSLQDQFYPLPSDTDFDEALLQVALPRLERAIRRRGVFTDIIRRSLFIASEQPLEAIPQGFRQIFSST